MTFNSDETVLQAKQMSLSCFSVRWNILYLTNFKLHIYVNNIIQYTISIKQMMITSEFHLKSEVDGIHNVFLIKKLPSTESLLSVMRRS